MTEISQPLPYYEPFNYPNGNSWPLAVPNTSGWQIPGPDGMQGGLGDVNGGLGRITFTSDWLNGTPQFSARLPIDDAPTFDMSFTLDIFNMKAALNQQDTGFWFRVQLEDAATGVDYYEIYYDPVNNSVGDGVQASIYKYVNSFSGGTTGGPVDLAHIAVNQAISVRIQESGTTRSLKVWQGMEPDLWTILDNAAPAHSGQRHIDLTTFAQVGGPTEIYLDELKVNVPGVTWISVGATQHFEFFYDAALGPVNGGADALAAMVNAEADLQNHFNWWGSTAPWSNGPGLLDIRFILPAHNTVPNANAYYDRSVESIFFIWEKTDPGNSNYCSINAGWRGEFVHELGHHFQRLQNDRWGGAASMVESQATFLDREFRRQIGDMDDLNTSGYGDGVTFWIQADPFTRADYVNSVVQDSSGDWYGEFFLALGCELLFFNYLRWHRGYSAAAITQHPGTTLRKAYESLTGDKADPFPTFLAEIDAAFPRGQYFPANPPWFEAWPSKDIANPYPLPGTTTPLLPGAGAAATYGFVNGMPMSLQALKQFLRRH